MPKLIFIFYPSLKKSFVKKMGIFNKMNIHSVMKFPCNWIETFVTFFIRGITNKNTFSALGSNLFLR